MSHQSSCLLKSTKTSSPYKLTYYEDDRINKSDSETNKIFEQYSDFEYEIGYLNPNSLEPVVPYFDSNNNRLVESLPQYNKPKKRFLPEIPEHKLSFRNLIDSNAKKKSNITRQISNTLSLQIELNENQKPISLKLIDKDQESINLKQSNGSLNTSKDELIDCRALNEHELRETDSVNDNDLFLGHTNLTNKLSGNKIEGNYRGLHRFIARHDDEISIDIGDSIYVIKQEDDHWFKGINLATNTTGYFPSLYVIDCNYDELFQTVNYFRSSDDCGLNYNNLNDLDCEDWIDSDKECFQVQKERYNLEFLGSLEVVRPNGNQVLEQCIKKVEQAHLKQANFKNTGAKNFLSSFLCILEISDFGLRFYNPQQLNESIHRRNSSSNIDENGRLSEDKRSNEERKLNQNTKLDQAESILNDNVDLNIDTICDFNESNLNENSAKLNKSNTSKLTKKNNQSFNQPLKTSNEDYFFHLKNITFCGSKENWFAFITKHPTSKQKYACHVFNSSSIEVSKGICESIGKSFHKFYLNYIELSQSFIE